MLLEIAVCAKLGVQFLTVAWLNFEIVDVEECCDHTLNLNSCKTAGWLTFVLAESLWMLHILVHHSKQLLGVFQSVDESWWVWEPELWLPWCN